MRGSVFKRGRTWTAQVYLGRDAVTGRKRYRQLGGFGTKRAAEQALTEQLERLRVGEYVDAGATTVAGFVERWLTAVEPSLRPTTFASYRNLDRKSTRLNPSHLCATRMQVSACTKKQ